MLGKLVVPPLFLAVAVAAMVALDRFVPLIRLVSAPWTKAGLVPVVAGVTLIVWSAALFIRARTPLHPHQPAKVLLGAGPYRISRNPIYLGMAFILCGLWLGLGSLTPGLALPAFVWAIQRRFIRHEERHLDQRFGESYRLYQESVRRWL